jgi:CRP-like cAMP-binding protein
MVKVSADQVIFNQGEASSDFFVVIRGSVNERQTREDMANIPVNVRTCYDGDYFGELTHFQVSETIDAKSADKLNR